MNESTRNKFISKRNEREKRKEREREKGAEPSGLREREREREEPAPVVMATAETRTIAPVSVCHATRKRSDKCSIDAGQSAGRLSGRWKLGRRQQQFHIEPDTIFPIIK